jgi:hypothetical protein
MYAVSVTFPAVGAIVNVMSKVCVPGTPMLAVEVQTSVPVTGVTGQLQLFGLVTMFTAVAPLGRMSVKVTAGT